MFLLDTNVLSELAKQCPDTRVLDWLKENITHLALPFSAVYELERGICSLRRKDPVRAEQLLQWLDKLLASGLPFLSMDAPTARIYATISSHPALTQLWVPEVRAGRVKSREDLAIAALAISCNAAIATMNVRDFRRIHDLFPLPGIYNPALSEWIVPFCSDDEVTQLPLAFSPE